MKNGRQWLSLILCLFLLAGSSCSGDNSPHPRTTTESTDTESVSAEAEERTDMDGFTLRVSNLDPASFSWANIQFTAEEENGLPINDAIFRRNHTIMETYNCVIAEEIHTDEDLAHTVVAGEDKYDIVMVYDTRVPNAMAYLQPWNDIPHIDLTEKWWNPDASAVFSIDGMQYVTAGDTTLSYLSRAMCYLYNKSMYQRLGLAYDLYTLVEEGRWTLDIFHEIAYSAVQDVNGDERYNKQDCYGIYGNARAVYNTLLGGAGIRYISSDANGKYTFTLAADEEAIGYMEKIIADNARYPHLFFNTASMVYDITPEGLFENGQALFHVQGMPHTIEQLREMEDDFGILPLPKRDETQSRYYSSTYGATVCGLPRTLSVKRFDNIGILLEEITRLTYTDIVPQYKEVLLKSKYSRDAGSADMLDIVFNNLFFDPGIVLWSGPLSDKIVQNVFAKNSTAVVSYLITIEPVANELIADFDAALGSR